MKKIIFIGQIIVIHLWFIFCSYSMITAKEEKTYIGFTPSSAMPTYEIFFYISFFVLIVFYAYLFAVKALKKKK